MGATAVPLCSWALKPEIGKIPAYTRHSGAERAGVKGRFHTRWQHFIAQAKTNGCLEGGCVKQAKTNRWHLHAQLYGFLLTHITVHDRVCAICFRDGMQKTDGNRVCLCVCVCVCVCVCRITVTQAKLTHTGLFLHPGREWTSCSGTSPCCQLRVERGGRSGEGDTAGGALTWAPYYSC